MQKDTGKEKSEPQVPASSLERVIRDISVNINRIGVGFLAVMMFMTGIDVVMRYIFNRPISGVYELTELMMVILVFFGLAYAQVNKEHVAVDLVYTRFAPKMKTIANCVSCFLCMGLFVIMTWQSIKQAQGKWNSGLMTGTLGIPLWPFYLITAMGCLVTCFVFIADLLKSARKWGEE